MTAWIYPPILLSFIFKFISFWNVTCSWFVFNVLYLPKLQSYVWLIAWLWPLFYKNKYDISSTTFIVTDHWLIWSLMWSASSGDYTGPPADLQYWSKNKDKVPSNVRNGKLPNWFSWIMRKTVLGVYLFDMKIWQ